MPDNLQTEALAIILIFPIASTLVMILRFYSRFLSRQFGWDDGLILIAWLLAVGQTVTIWVYTKLSWQGYHSWDIPEQSITQQIQTERYNLANQLLYNPILAIVKASIIIFLFRLEDHRRIVRWNLHILAWVNWGLMISIFLADLFQCTPLHYVYDYPAMDAAAQQAAGADKQGMKDSVLVKGGKCFDQIKFYLGSAELTILTDVWLLCIPTIIVWRLQMNRRKKLAIIAVLSMGVIVTAIGITRVVIYKHLLRPHNDDPTYNIGHTTSTAEVNVAIIAASATALPALFKRIAAGGSSSSDHSSGRLRDGGGWVLSPISTDRRCRGQQRDTYPVTNVTKARPAPATSQEHIMRDGEVSS
ncbi:uncharacterized protein BDV14DRAFT_203159 [Aspergillus stella-maris]|uniref:uncharacterized protein n=1 Tax=Aspergillus stella-maris TaxID=1810926 RepID=UPI003CCDD555